MAKDSDLKMLRILLSKQYARAFLGVSLHIAFLYVKT